MLARSDLRTSQQSHSAAFGNIKQQLDEQMNDIVDFSFTVFMAPNQIPFIICQIYSADESTRETAKAIDKINLFISEL